MHKRRRLPGVRAFSRQQAVSITTALHCYRLLEAEGFVQVRPQSGFFVRQRQQPSVGPELPVFEGRVTTIKNIRVIEQIQEAALCRDNVPLGTSLLAPALVPATLLQRSLVRISRRLGERLFHYGAPEGELSLREALSRHFKEDGLSLRPDELVITNGCMDAVSLALQLCTRPGGVVAVLTPCFSGLLQVIESLDRRVLEVPLHYKGIYLERLRRAMQREDVQACLLSGNNHNPLGFTLDADTKRQIADWAAELQCPIIEDDVFGESGFGPQRELPIKAWDRNEWVFWCGSFSKTLAPAYRLGWCAPGRWRREALQLRRARTISINLPLQLTLADFIHCGEYRRHIHRLRLNLARQVDQMRAAVLQSFPPGTAVTLPQGGFVLWVTLPVQVDGMWLYSEAAKAGINIVPGAVFSTEQRYGNCVRLNAGNPFDGRVKGAIITLGKLAHRKCQIGARTALSE